MNTGSNQNTGVSSTKKRVKLVAFLGMLTMLAATIILLQKVRIIFFLRATACFNSSQIGASNSVASVTIVFEVVSMFLFWSFWSQQDAVQMLSKLELQREGEGVLCTEEIAEEASKKFD